VGSGVQGEGFGARGLRVEVKGLEFGDQSLRLRL